MFRLFSEYGSIFRDEFRGYSARGVARDLMAGLTVAAVALPLALAFGVSSGATAGSGLITAIIAGLIMSLLAGAFYQISGPTGAMAAILMSLVVRYGLEGMFLATLIAGVLLIIAAVLHLGQLTTYIPMPVITGFTSGIAVIIALGQIDNFFGVTSQGTTALEKLKSYGTLGFSPDWITLGIGLAVILLLVFFPKKWNAVVPASLVAIILATAATMIFDLNVATVGEIPKTLLPETRLHFADITWARMGELLTPAISICLLGMVESLLCGASAGRMTGVRLRSDNELFAQGIGNLILPFFGGIPATAAIARTSVAVKSGAVTRLTGVFHGLGLLISLFLLSGVMSSIPLSALAGVLLVTAWRMNDWESIRYFFSHRFKGAILKYLATLFATIFFDLTIAIVIGVGIALLLLVSRLARLEINSEPVDPDRAGMTDPHQCARFANALVVYVTGPLLFANIAEFERVPELAENADTVLFSLRGMSYLDVTGAQTILQIHSALTEEGKTVLFCGLSDAARLMMERAGIVAAAGEDCFYWSVETALSK